MRDISLRPSGAGQPRTRRWSWASPALGCCSGLLRPGSGLAALLTFARRDSRDRSAPSGSGLRVLASWPGPWCGTETAAGPHDGRKRARARRRRPASCWLTSARFLQDAAHQLKTPITIALGHAELLAAELAGHREQQDIYVMVGELTQAQEPERAPAPDRGVPGPRIPLPGAGRAGRLPGRGAAALAATARRVWATGRLDAVTVQRRPRAPGAGPGRPAGERRPAHRRWRHDQALGPAGR